MRGFRRAIESWSVFKVKLLLNESRFWSRSGDKLDSLAALVAMRAAFLVTRAGAEGLPRGSAIYRGDCHCRWCWCAKLSFASRVGLRSN